MQALKTTYGKVYITGAGPGDPALLTLRAKDLIEKAEVILYDNLIHPDILEWASAGCKKIFVGKLPYCSSIRQETINQLLVDHAQQGKMVVRLKGGDPFIFGRGAEEAVFLKLNGVEFEIVPGVTSSLAAGAYAGIPLTHRDVSQSVLFITGHTKKEKNTGLNFNWPLLAAFDGTIVFYMGVKNLHVIASELIKEGKPGSTPAAIIENGSLLHQRVIMGNLENIEILAAQAAIGTPSLIVVGEVVKYHQELNWFSAVQEQLNKEIA